MALPGAPCLVPRKEKASLNHLGLSGTRYWAVSQDVMARDGAPSLTVNIYKLVLMCQMLHQALYPPFSFQSFNIDILQMSQPRLRKVPKSAQGSEFESD